VGSTVKGILRSSRAKLYTGLKFIPSSEGKNKRSKKSEALLKRFGCYSEKVEHIP